MVSNHSISPSSLSRQSGITLAAPSSGLVWESAAWDWPSWPGDYWVLDAAGQVLYVGKAKNLRRRLHQYQQFSRLSPRIKQMVSLATQVKHQVLANELIAILTEAELIRLHQPEYNIMLKDDKTPLYIHITDEKFPRVLTARKKEITTGRVLGTVLGPFNSDYQVKQILKLARAIFSWCNQASQPTGRACFYYHLELCPGACLNRISAADYQQQIHHLIDFLRGKQKQVVRAMTKEMRQAADGEHFEQAALLHRQLELVADVTNPARRLAPTLTLPALKDDTAQESGLQLSHLLGEYFHLPRTFQLSRIEGYDVSNLQGKQAAVAMVVFNNGQPDSDQYRLFNIKTIDTPNDYHMLQEALIRRQKHPEWGIPDLIVIDGGRGQLRSAQSVWKWPCPVISIAKNPDRLIIPRSTFSSPVGKKDLYHFLKLPDRHLALKLIQYLRNEAHRFSKKQHTRRRLKAMLTDHLTRL